MALRKLVRSNYGGKSPVSIKYENLHSFKEGVILLCQSILETRRICHLHGLALLTIPVIIPDFLAHGSSPNTDDESVSKKIRTRFGTASSRSMKVNVNLVLRFLQASALSFSKALTRPSIEAEISQGRLIYVIYRFLYSINFF